MDRDIVERLREIAGPIVPNVCTDAAEAIERLRARVGQLEADASALAAERDEARRHACEQRRILPAPWAMEPKDFAFTMGWDLYDNKEDRK
jgi:hypothetical protein